MRNPALNFGGLPDPNKGLTTDQLILSLSSKLHASMTLEQALETLSGKDLILAVAAIKQRFPHVTNAQLCSALGY